MGCKKLDIVSECTLSCSGSGGDQKAAASTLISTAQRIASQLSPNTPAPTPASTPQANFLNLPNINLQGILGSLPGGSNGVNLLVALLMVPMCCPAAGYTTCSQAHAHILSAAAACTPMPQRRCMYWDLLDGQVW